MGADASSRFVSTPWPTGAAARLRQGGVYLITGGMGGVGLVLADYLAREFKAKLVLTGTAGAAAARAVGRPHGVARSAGARMPRRAGFETVEALEAAGGEVLVGAADVIDEAAMRAVVDEACARFGRIDGVIHAAGVAGGGMIQLKTPEIADAVLAPKVTGTQVLERVLAGRQLDFLMLCSSLTGVLGGVGQVDYCGANAYLDAFAAHYTATTGNFGIAVNWNAWREVGMAVDTDVPVGLKDALKGAMLASGITNSEGVDAFRRILAQATDAQVALSPFDVQLGIEAEGLPDEGDEPTLRSRWRRWFGPAGGRACPAESPDGLRRALDRRRKEAVRDLAGRAGHRARWRERQLLRSRRAFAPGRPGHGFDQPGAQDVGSGGEAVRRPHGRVPGQRDQSEQ